MKTYGANTYNVSRINGPVVFTVQANTIREAIVYVADRLFAGVEDKEICRERFAFVTLVRGEKSGRVLIEKL